MQWVKRAAAVVGAGAGVLITAGMAAAQTSTTSVASAFSGTGNGVLDNVTAILPDVLIPFVALLAIGLGVKLYHKVRG